MLDQEKFNIALIMLMGFANGQKELSTCNVSQIYLRQRVSKCILVTSELV